MPEASVLIVEDEGLVAQELKERLEALGCSVLGIVRRGEDAVQQASVLQPDLILMDVRLAGPMDGITAARNIRDERRIPVIFVTAYGDTSTVDRASETEPYGYILKPFDGAALRIAVATALHRSRIEKERDRAHEELALSEARQRKVRESLETILQDCPAVIFRSPVQKERTFTYVSPSFRQLLGDEPSLAQTPGFWRARVHPDDAPLAQSEWEKSLISKRLWNEYRIRHADGNYRWVREEGTVLPQQGEVMGFWTDITREQEVEVDMRRAHRLAAVGSVISGLAHEIRNPLFAISAAVESLESDWSAATFSGYKSVLRSQVKRIADLMNQLREFGRSQPITLSPEPPREILNEAVELCQQDARRAGVTIVVQGDAEEGAVLADRTRLVLVFRNVIENAVQHSPRGAVVDVSVRSEGDSAMYEVRDLGTGFRPEDLANVFEPFFTRRRGGTGLGLSIAQQIAREHGAELRASNDTSGGAIVTLRLPLLPKPE